MNFQITHYVMSPDQRYAIVNIRNEMATDTPGPFYRFVVISLNEQKIFFPPMKELLSNDLGIPYISAKFNENNLLAVAYGNRFIEATVVSLPDGKVIKTQELDVFEVEEINKALTRLLK